MRFRKLRTVWSVCWGVASLLLVALWMRSHGVIDIVGSGKHCLMSVDGCVYLDEILRVEGSNATVAWFSGDTTLPYIAVQFRNANVIPNGTGWRLPFWFVFAFTLSVCVVPWIRWRFSLRTLLIAITLVAVLLGTAMIR